MAIGIRDRLQVDVGVSTTGIAGPSGGSHKKPVGLLFVAVSKGDRIEVREQAVVKYFHQSSQTTSSPHSSIPAHFNRS